jgi:hypothetical protein
LKSVSGAANEPAKEQRFAEFTKDLIQVTDGIGTKLNVMAKECSLDYRYPSD